MKTLPKVRLPRPKNMSAAEERLAYLNESTLNENFERISLEVNSIESGGAIDPAILDGIEQEIQQVQSDVSDAQNAITTINTTLGGISAGVSGDWTYFKLGGYCILTFAYQASGVSIQNSEGGQYQSDTLDTEIYLPSWVTGIKSVMGSAGSGSQGAGARLHRVTLWSTSDSVKFVLARPSSGTNISFPFTVIVFGTC